MEKYKLRNGDIWDVEDKNIEAFLLQNKGAVQMDYTPDVSTQANTTRFEVGEEIHDVLDRDKKDFLANFEGQKIVEHDKRGDEFKSVYNIKHVDVNELEKAVGDSWWSKEENAAGYLTEFYRKQDLDVKFIEAKAGYNVLRMVVNGEELEGDIDLKGGFLSTGETDWGDLAANFQNKIDDAFGDKEETVKREKLYWRL